MRIFDTHCHFQSDILADTTKAISDAKYAGVVKLMNNSISFSDWNKVLIISENNTEVVPALGIHPCFIDLSIESIKTEPERSIYQQVANSPGLKVENPS